MRIVIAGAGDVGVHLARLLVSENQDIVLIDRNAEVLEHVSNSMDIETIQGDASSLKILTKAQVGKARLFLAVTTSEKDNLIASILAKKLGAKKTVARVSNQEFLEKESQELFESQGVDHVISPTLLAANEIVSLVEYQGVTDLFYFEEGKFNLFGVLVTADSVICNLSFEQMSTKFCNMNFQPVAVLRGRQTLLPQPHVRIQSNDHIYFLSDEDHKEMLLKNLGIKKLLPKRIMILGGRTLGLTTAKMLEEEFHVTLIEESKDLCKKLVAELEDTLVVKGNPGDMELLIQENLEKMDVFIALTPNSETNILTSLMASNHGVNKTIALVDNTDYIHISQNIGVEALINKKLIAANNIFRFIRKGQIEAIASLHGVDAEVIEFVVHGRRNKLTRLPIEKLKMPKGAVVGGVIRNQQCIIPEPSFKFEPDDKVIVLALPEAIHRVEAIFR